MLCMLLPSYTVLPRSIDIHRPSLPLSGHEPEEKLPSPRAGSGALASQSATPIDPSDPSYRNYFTKIQAELSPQKNPVVSNNMSYKIWMYLPYCRTSKLPGPTIFHFSLLSPISFNHPSHGQLFLTWSSCLSPLPFITSTPPLPSPLQELASIRRREHLVREAMVGKSPGVYSQLFKRSIISTPLLSMINFKWGHFTGLNWFNLCTCPKWFV